VASSISAFSRLVDRLEQRLPQPARTILEKARGQDVMLFASGLSFYALVSVVPLAILVIWVSSLVLGDQRVHAFAAELKHVAPKNLDVGRFVQRVADLGTSLGVLALLTALWPATSYGAGLRRAFDRLGPKNPKEPRGMKGRGLALVVLLPLFVMGSLLGSYVGTALLGGSTLDEVLGVGLAFVLGFVGTAIAVALIYRLFPPERLELRAIVHGTIWSATTISLLSLAFTLFVDLGANFQEHYGTSGVAALVLLAVWLFLANALLLVGFRVALDA
jgi:YihY family inner membrane protein